MLGCRSIFRLLFIGGLNLVIMPNAAIAADYMCRTVGPAWTWFGDHIAISVDYVSVGASSRRYEVGTGISVGGSPRGRREVYSGTAEFTAYGIGAVHIRQSDSGEPFKVCVSSAGLSPITIYSQEF